MKILHINSYFSTSGLFKQLYDRQVSNGCDLDVYVPIPYDYPDERMAASGSYTTISPCYKSYERAIFHLKHRRILNDLKDRFDYPSYDLMHAHSLFSNGYLAYHLWKQYKIPYVVSVRNTDVRTFFERMPLLRKMGLDILRQAQAVIFISRNSYNQVLNNYIPENFRDEFIIKTQVIPNGIDNFWHENRYEERVFPLDSPIKIISTGKIMGRKRFIQLAEMVQIYDENIQAMELHIVGPDWNKKIVKKLEQFPQVHYHGPMKREELRDIYRKMDIFALLSYPETFGLVYPEAMSQGLPVIYTKNEGFDSFFKNCQVGVSVDKTNQLQFNQAVDFIIKYYYSISKNALIGSQLFDWDNVTSSYLKIYQNIIKGD